MSSSSGAARPARGEVWEVSLDPTVGREQAGSRPALVVSDDALNHSPRGLVIVAPISGTVRGFPTHVPISPPEGGLTKPSVIMTEQVRAVSKDRLGARYGAVTQATMDEVSRAMTFVLGL